MHVLAAILWAVTSVLAFLEILIVREIVLRILDGLALALPVLDSVRQPPPPPLSLLEVNMEADDVRRVAENEFALPFHALDSAVQML